MTRFARSEMAPVFVFGVDDLDAAILYRMLAYHPDLTWFSQFSLRAGQIPGRARRPGADRLDRPLRFMRHSWRKEEPSSLSRLLVPHPDTGEVIWNHLFADEEIAAQRVRFYLTALSKRHGRKRVLANRREFDHYLEVLWSAFPTANFVQIVREGPPVALSGTPGIDLLEIRHEDLCDDVHGVILSVLEHTALDPSTFPLRRCPRMLESRDSRELDPASRGGLKRTSRI
jgi:hypothetical protein